MEVHEARLQVNILNIFTYPGPSILFFPIVFSYQPATSFGLCCLLMLLFSDPSCLRITRKASGSGRGFGLGCQLSLNHDHEVKVGTNANLLTVEQQSLDGAAGNLVKEGCVVPADTEVGYGAPFPNT